MAKKVSITEDGEKEFERLMLGIASDPINIFLDFNAVIVNLNSLSWENQKFCLAKIEKRENVKILFRRKHEYQTEFA